MSNQKYVVVGDGIAGATAAETLREEDEEAEIHVFTDESEPLYNRIMLKNYMKGDLPGKKFTRIHDENWYEKRDIKLHLEAPVEDVDTDANEVKTAEGEFYEYDRCLIATGGSPRRMPQDEGYDNLHYMWTMGDATAIKESAEEANEAVVIGGGLLGIDLAMAYASNGCETHYLIRGKNWFSRGLDEEGAEIMHRKMEENGVNVVTETSVEEFESEDGEVTAALSKDGRRFECDAVAVAIGQTPNSSLVDVEKNDAGMVKTDEHLKTSDPDVFAAGNMVEYYSPVFEKRNVNGSWDHSEAMGECAARNMLGEETEFDFVNTYGVGHFDVQFLSIGSVSGDFRSYKKESSFVKIFINQNCVVGGIVIGGGFSPDRIKSEIGHSSSDFLDCFSEAK